MMKINICEKPNGTTDCDALVLRGEKIEKDIDLSSLYRGVPLITPLYERDGFLCASVVSGEGVYTQRAITLNANYHNKTDSELNVFSIGGVCCALVVDADVYRPEIFRYLALKGVKLVFCPRFVDESRYCGDFVMFGPWSNAQANNMFIVDVNNIESNIICPCGLCVDNSGFIERGRKGEFIAELPTERFFEGQRSFPVFQSLNSELYRECFERDTP